MELELLQLSHGPFLMVCLFRRDKKINPNSWGANFFYHINSVWVAMKVYGFVCGYGLVSVKFICFMLNFRCGRIFGSSRAANIHQTKIHGEIRGLHETSIRRDNVEDLEFSDDGTAAYLIK